MTKQLSRLPFGQRVFKARKELGWSQEWLAEKAGTTRRHVIRIEQSENAPRKELRGRLVEVLGGTEAFRNGDDDEEEDSLPSLDDFLKDHIAKLVARELERV